MRLEARIDASQCIELCAFELAKVPRLIDLSQLPQWSPFQYYIEHIQDGSTLSPHDPYTQDHYNIYNRYAERVRQLFSNRIECLVSTEECRQAEKEIREKLEDDLHVSTSVEEARYRLFANRMCFPVPLPVPLP